MFSAWLQPVLLEKDIDYDVYGSYIVSILSEEDDADAEMKKESLNEILQSFMEEDCTSLSDEILAKWNHFNSSSQQDDKGDVSAVTKLIATHLNVEANQIIKTSSATTKEEEERASIKKSVIAMYNQDEDEQQEEHQQQSWNGTSGSSETNGVFQNTNVSSIIEKEKMERNKQKDDAAKKKERDKQERKNQENKKAERKEKEKKRTQKKERNR